MALTSFSAMLIMFATFSIIVHSVLIFADRLYLGRKQGGLRFLKKTTITCMVFLTFYSLVVNGLRIHSAMFFNELRQDKLNYVLFAIVGSAAIFIVVMVVHILTLVFSVKPASARFFNR